MAISAHISRVFLWMFEMVKKFLEEIHVIAQALHDNGMPDTEAIETALVVVKAQREKRIKDQKEESRSRNQRDYFLLDLIKAIDAEKIKLGKEYTATEVAKKLNIINPTRSDATKVATTIRRNLIHTARRGSLGERLIKINGIPEILRSAQAKEF